jgi:hypothetical protein
MPVLSKKGAVHDLGDAAEQGHGLWKRFLDSLPNKLFTDNSPKIPLNGDKDKPLIMRISITNIYLIHRLTTDSKLTLAGLDKHACTGMYFNLV